MRLTTALGGSHNYDPSNLEINMSEEETKAPEHWSELTDEQRKELVDMVDARLLSRKVWKVIFRKLERVKGLGTVILTMAAVWALLGDSIAEGINQWLNAK